MLDLLIKNWKRRVWCSLFNFFHVICKISNFNMWTTKHLVQASWTELTLAPPFTLALRTERPTTNELKGLHVYFRYLVVRKTSTNMGSFIGHAVPGAFFTLGALWWTFNIFWRYFTAHFNQLHHGAKKGGAYKNTLSFSCDILCTKRFVLKISIWTFFTQFNFAINIACSLFFLNSIIFK